MKKLLPLFIFSASFFKTELSFSQSFTVSAPDTIVYLAPAAGKDTSLEANSITNTTPNALPVDVLRIQDDTLTPGWTSSFCLVSCYPPYVDSVRYIIPANQTIPLMVHFKVTATPDSGTVVMQVKLPGTTAGSFTHRFYCVTQIGFGVNEESAYRATVNIFPSPVLSGNNFNINISNVKIKSKEISLVIYDILGSAMRTVHELKEGNNTLNVDLAAGIYSYRLLSGSTEIHSGKLSIVK